MTTRNVLSAVLACALAAAGVGAADDDDNDTQAFHIKLSDPARPGRLVVETTMGKVTVRGGNVQDFVFEMSGDVAHLMRHPHGEDNANDPKARGLKRLEVPGQANVEIQQNNNVVTVKNTAFTMMGDIVVTVPRRSSVQAKSLAGGEISVQNVEGELDIDNINGGIDLKNVSGNILAHSLNGAITATLDRVDPAKPMSFSTMNGEIDVALPSDTKADLRIKTDNGDVFTDFDVRLAKEGNIEASRSQQMLRIQKSVHGAINGGGPEYRFASFNGRIYIRKRK